MLVISCQNAKKQKPQKKIKTTLSKKQQTAPPTKTNVVVDKNGVANVIITSNDGMKFDVRKINVKAGQKIKLTLKHTGKLDKKIMGHNVVFLKNTIKPSTFAIKAGSYKNNDYIPEGTTDVIAHTKMIGGGETTFIEFTAPESGTYNYICSFPGHYAMMKGKLLVE